MEQILFKIIFYIGKLSEKTVYKEYTKTIVNKDQKKNLFHRLILNLIRFISNLDLYLNSFLHKKLRKKIIKTKIY